MTDRFTDRVVLITGGASGLGRATAVRVAGEGAKLVLVDINGDGLQASADEVAEAAPGAEVLLVTADVADERGVERYVAETLRAHGRIDGFFNNAGIEGRQNLTQDFGTDEFDRVVSVNLRGVFLGMKHVLTEMSKQGSGTIVNMSSVGGIRGIGNQSGYAASKHGVVGLTRNSGIEYGKFGITVKAIAPGAVMTPMVRGFLEQVDPDNPEEAGKQFVRANPMRRFGRPEEVAHLAAFLLSDEASFINATTVVLDGGQSEQY